MKGAPSRGLALATAAVIAAAPGSARARTPPPAVPVPAHARAGLVDVSTAIETDARYATARNFTGAVLPGYCEPRVLLLARTARRLALVDRDLGRRLGLGLKVFDGYRPVRATRAMVRWAERTGNRRLLDGGYIARRSSHNLGTSVDLTLVDQSRRHRELDMGTPYDAFTPSSSTLAARGRVLRNRLTLKRAMERHGFRNYAREWWHYDSLRPGPRRLDVPIGIAPPGSRSSPPGCPTIARSSAARPGTIGR